MILLRGGTHDFCAGDKLAINFSSTFKGPDISLVAQVVGFQPQLVAGNYWPFKADFVQADQIVGATLTHQALNGPACQQSGGLSECLNDEDTWHDWDGWKVAGKERFVVCHVLDREQSLTGFNFNNPVNQKKRIPVREILLNFLDVQIVWPVVI